MRIFVINPGSTSTRLALYAGGQAVFSREFQHDKAEIARFPHVADQFAYRLAAVETALADGRIDPGTLDGVAGRGGLLRPMEGGVYEVSDAMLDDLQSARYGEHACNLGASLAREVARRAGVGAYIVDPVVTDELADVARITGLPDIRRRSLFHALSQRGAARTAAARLGVAYGEADFIVCHMGGGISIGAHRRGRVVEVVNALDGEGPFSPERTGGLPLVPVLEMLERGEQTPATLKRAVLREGGLFAHLGTNDLREVVRRMGENDDQARTLFQALAYGVSRHIGSLAPALADEAGRVTVAAVVLTGGLARSAQLVHEIMRMVGYLGPVEVVTGDEEMAALAGGVIRALTGAEPVKTYGPAGGL
ncbi:MAG: butyrate kinase [Proteobacteria bacterium]|nr:butyrate kinase [Pseudomonadota bacterium]MBU4244092.1 butyrate kinase [Pseudomonadota bacterium]MBU4379321.1 butyrate kinase [Pseudomonadota bacterium]MBU4476453.1 butyrate kinase [Pseudomonadota bacterium]MBU4517447.1 butyrate kinase [Pseudomonadota bacterium]